MLAAKSGSHTEEIGAGIIQLDVTDSGQIFMEQPVQEFKQVLDRAEVVAAFGVSQDAVRADLPLQIVADTLMVGMHTEAAVNALTPDMQRLTDFSRQHNFEGFHVYVLKQGELLASTRNFCPILGIDEESATGTSNGSFLAYLQHYNVLPSQDTFVIEQGESMHSTSRLYGTFHDGRVWMGGNASVRKQEIITI